MFDRYFGEHGWPSSTILSKPPVEDDEKIKLIDTIQVGNLTLILLVIYSSI